MSTQATMPTMVSETDVRPHRPNKYLYPEFAGWVGERYVKKLLRQILPMALYRTWEICAEQQANGNVCYVGVSQLAAIAGRTSRTMQKNLAELEARQLLVERAERTVFGGSDEAKTSRAVVVKDFSQLYALAHEYHEWVNAADYIAPVRELRTLIAQDPHLVAKLRRFDKYRRVLYHQQPGPPPKAREEDRWFTEYQAEETSPAHAGGHALAASEPHPERMEKKQAAKQLPKQLAKDSPKRITVTGEKNPPQGDSYDSAFPCSETTWKTGEGTPPRPASTAAVCEHEQTTPEREARRTALDGAGPPLLASTPSPPSIQHGEQRHREDETEVKREGQPVTVEQGRQLPTPQPGEYRSSPPDHPLVRSFVQEISAPFGDGNPKGSLTRVLSILASARLSHPAEVLLCLVRAYTVARDTRTIRAEHWDARTGRANRMPLFCAMVERLVEARVQGKMGDASWHQVEEEIAADEHLARWWKDHRHLIGTLAPIVFNTPDQEQNRPGVCCPDNAPESAQRGSHAPLRPTRPLRCSHHDSVFPSASGGTSLSPAIVPSSAHQSNQYESYVNALMAKYSAPEAWQEVL